MRQSVEIAAKPVTPLHGADGNHAGTRRENGFDVFDKNPSVAIRDGVDLDAEFIAFLHPGDGNFQEFQITDHDAIAGFQRDGIGDKAKAMGGALDQRNVAFEGIDQLGDLRSRCAPHGVHIKVMLSG